MSIVDEEKKIIQVSQFDLRNPESLIAFRENSLPIAEQERYSKLGEEMYSMIDFQQNIQLGDEFDNNPNYQQTDEIIRSLRSGQLIEDLTDAELNLMDTTFGVEWRKEWTQ